MTAADGLDCLYRETAGPFPDVRRLDGDRIASVAIIGAGLTGLSAALQLAEQGVETVVLEAQTPGWGASGRNGGQVNPGLKHDPVRIIADFGPDLGERMAALSGQAPDFVFKLVQRHQIQCEAIQSGTLRAAPRPALVAALRETHDQWFQRDAPVALLDPTETRAMTGTGRYAGALLDRRGGQLHPLKFTFGLARAAIAAGATIHGETPARRVRRADGRWHVETPAGTVSAEKLILATNGYTDDLWPGLRRAIVPVYSAITASVPVPAATARDILPSRPVLYEIGPVTVYYRLDAENRLLMGGRSVQRPVSGAGALRYLSDYAEKLWPTLSGIRWTHGWSGQLAITRDHYPHVHAPHETVLACLGYNGRGLAMSTAMGPELARWVMGGPSARIDMPVTQIKTIPFHGLWRPAVRTKVAYERMREWLGL
jgi:glycine/D-amino acid oxidase-like deaminating enzyme